MDDASVVGQRGFHHAALLYQVPDDFAVASLDFIGDGLAAGDAVFVASTSASAAQLRMRLGRQADLVRLLVMSRLGANPGRILAMMRVFGGQHRDRAVRYVQELYWPGRPLTELREAMRLEAQAVPALAGGSVRLLCGYDARLESGLLSVAERAHQAGGAAGLDELGGLDELSAPPDGAAALRFRDEQAEVRRFVAAQARQAGLAPPRVTDLVLVAGELAANTLAHTDGQGQLTMWKADGMVVCQVSDGGQISDPLAGTVCPDPAATGRRRGLWLVQQVSDLVQIRSGPAGTTIRVHMRLGP